MKKKRSIHEIRDILTAATQADNDSGVCKEHNISIRQLRGWQEEHRTFTGKAKSVILCMVLKDGSRNPFIGPKEYPRGHPMWYREHWREFSCFGFNYDGPVRDFKDKPK